MGCTEGHEWQCFSAKPGTKCECQCGGENHGVEYKERKPLSEEKKDAILSSVEDLITEAISKFALVDNA